MAASRSICSFTNRWTDPGIPPSIAASAPNKSRKIRWTAERCFSNAVWNSSSGICIRRAHFSTSAPALSQMTFESDGSLHLFINPNLDIANFVDRGKIEILSIDEGRDQFNEAFTQFRIPRHNASLCKGEALECFAPRIVISLKRAQR